MSCSLQTVGVFGSISGPNPHSLAIKDVPHVVTAILSLMLPDKLYHKLQRL